MATIWTTERCPKGEKLFHKKPSETYIDLIIDFIDNTSQESLTPNEIQCMQLECQLAQEKANAATLQAKRAQRVAEASAKAAEKAVKAAEAAAKKSEEVIKASQEKEAKAAAEREAASKKTTTFASRKTSYSGAKGNTVPLRFTWEWAKVNCPDFYKFYH